MVVPMAPSIMAMRWRSNCSRAWLFLISPLIDSSPLSDRPTNKSSNLDTKICSMELTRLEESRSLARMGAKDWLVEKAGMAMLNQAVLRPYGTLTQLKLDSSARTIEAEL